MGYKYLENILEELSIIPPDSIVSHTITNDDHVNITLFGFAAGQELSEHTSTMPAIIEIIHGEGRLTIGNEHFPAVAGTWVYLPPRLEHSMIADTDVAMLLYLLK